MLAYRAGEHVRLVSRNGRHHTRRFADIAAAMTKLSARTLMIEGVGAIYDQLPPVPIRGLREARPGRSPRSRS
jgi:ATP-dependent DNA ligase